MKGKRILGVFVLGAVVGAIFGIFSSPYSGKETRKKIKDRTRKLIKVKKK